MTGFEHAVELRPRLDPLYIICGKLRQINKNTQVISGAVI